MNKKYFIGGLAGLVLAIGLTIPSVSKAANAVTVLAGLTTRTNLIPGVSNAVSISSITISGVTNLVPATFSFFDAPGYTNLHSANAIALTWSNIAYTTYSYSIVSITNTYTNIMGFITNDIFTARARTTNTVAAGINNYRLVYSVVIASNMTPLVVTFGTPQLNTHGLVMTNHPSATTVIDVEYSPRF